MSRDAYIDVDYGMLAQTVSASMAALPVILAALPSEKLGPLVEKWLGLPSDTVDELEEHPKTAVLQALLAAMPARNLLYLALSLPNDFPTARVKISNSKDPGGPLTFTAQILGNTDAN